MYNVVTIVDNTVAFNWNLLRVEPKCSHQKERKKDKHVRWRMCWWNSITGLFSQCILKSCFTLYYSFVTYTWVNLRGKESTEFWNILLTGYINQWKFYIPLASLWHIQFSSMFRQRSSSLWSHPNFMLNGNKSVNLQSGPSWLVLHVSITTYLYHNYSCWIAYN